MIQFKQSDTTAEMILTLTEKVSITDPYFLFVFTHVLTKEQVKFIKYGADDESDFTSRYNQFTINPSVVFAGKPTGQWHYKVYEQESDTNLIEASAIAIIEYGKLILNRETDFAFTTYNEPTFYKAYNG